MKQLKPCPFCGSTDIVKTDPPSPTTNVLYIISCSNCDATVYDLEDSVSAWNKRFNKYSSESISSINRNLLRAAKNIEEYVAKLSQSNSDRFNAYLELKIAIHEAEKQVGK